MCNTESALVSEAVTVQPVVILVCTNNYLANSRYYRARGGTDLVEKILVYNQAVESCTRSRSYCWYV